MLKNKSYIEQQKLNYKNATDLVKVAIMERNAGHIKVADSIINLSIETYPTLEIYGYAKLLMVQNDIKAANNIIDKQ